MAEGGRDRLAAADAGASPARLVVLGDVVTDVVARLSGPVVLAGDVDAQVLVRDGGSAANVAAWAAAAGGAVVLLGRRGDDRQGADAARALADAGVDVRLAVDAARPTGSIVVVVGADGERSMLTDRGANDALTPADVAVIGLRAGDHLHVTGYTLLHDGSRTAGLTALRRAAHVGATTSVSPSNHGALAPAARSAFLGWTTGVDLVIANADEARALAPPGVDELRWLAARHGEAVVTCGDEGAGWAGADGATLTVAAEPADVVDTTGAGDAFTAGFLVTRLAGGGIESALRAGALLGARAVAAVGGRPVRPPGHRR